MRNRFSKTFKLATVLFALPILAFLIAIVSSYSFSSSYQHSKAQNYFSNITMLYNKEGLLKSNIELPKSIHIKRGERLFLISEIPDWDSNELFLSFEVKNSNVKIFIDKQLFYEYSPKELAKINSNYGANYIVTKKIDAKYFGHEIILQFDPDLLINNHFILPQLNYGVSENILNTNYKDLSILIVNNIILICILFCLLIYFLLMKDKTTRLNLLSFLLLYLNLFFIFSILHSRIAVNLIPHPFLVAHLRPLIIATIPFCCIFFLSKAHNITTDLKTISLLRLTLLPSLIFYYGALLTKNQYLIFFASILQIVMQIEIILFLIFMIRKMEENPKYLKHALMILPLLITLDLISHFSYNIPNLINTSVILLPTVFAVTITAFSTNNYFKHSKVLLEKDLLRKLAYTDPLSGCFNRQAYQRRISSPFKHQNYYLMMDINNMKQINDTKGHAEGDFAIQSVGSSITPLLPTNSHIYRIGGDEFVCIIRASEVKNIEEFINVIKNTYYKATDNKYSLSIGYQVLNKNINKENLRQAIQEADERMYKNKSKFHGKVHQ